MSVSTLSDKALAIKPPSASTLMPLNTLSLTAPGVNLGAYINTISQIPILTPEQEKELAERYFYDGDVDAARELVLSHLRFVVHIARSYAARRSHPRRQRRINESSEAFRSYNGRAFGVIRSALDQS
jgi:DNA-directed RNA polymerase sigma subunit (sigma70/sigma32)